MIRYSEGHDGLDDLLNSLRPVTEPGCGLFLALSRGINEGRATTRKEAASCTGPSCITNETDQGPGPRVVSPDPSQQANGPRLARGSAGHLPPRRPRARRADR